MKKILIICVSLLLSSSFLLAQEEEVDIKKNKRNYNDREMKTLFGRQRSFGGYGAFWMGYSTVDDKHSLQFGGRGSWVLQHSFAIGFGGTGFINEYHYDIVLDKDVFLAGGYGGIYLEPVIFPGSPVHLSFPVLLGAGGVSFVSHNDIDWDSNYIEDYDAFLIVEPGVDIELNLTRFMRVGFGATYRFPTSFNVGQSPVGNVDAESLRGMTYNLTFKFGKF
ncbi:MAG: hypothetical protein V2I37_07600 [Marinilabiliaceae bacterium]|jgi:hypothetical protein|nr:hypothetical protein [Marinilabiliaceae bacterium]